jgi:hypothetical protein
VRIIPPMIDNALKIALDPYFPEPRSRSYKQETNFENRFELIFHEAVDGPKNPPSPYDDLTSDSDQETDSGPDTQEDA